MGDRGYTIGILIGCILLICAGLVFTWFEIEEYRQNGAPPPRTTVTRPDRSDQESDPLDETEDDSGPEHEEETDEAQ